MGILLTTFIEPALGILLALFFAAFAGGFAYVMIKDKKEIWEPLIGKDWWRAKARKEYLKNKENK